MEVPKLQKQARQEMFDRHIQRDSIKVTLNGKEYNARRTQPSVKRIMTLSGFDYTLSAEMLIKIEVEDKVPQSLNIVTEVETNKSYRIISVSHDFGTNCYLLSLGHKA